VQQRPPRLSQPKRCDALLTLVNDETSTFIETPSVTFASTSI